MATIQFLEDDELGFGVEKGADNKLTIKTDNSGNVTFTKSDAGLKGEVVFPPSQQVPEAVADVTYDPNTRTFTVTKTAGSAATTITLPAPTVDVKVAGLAFTDQGKLKATLSDNTEVETDFNAEVVVAALEGATQAQKLRIKAVLLDVLKGEEVQNFAGQTKGFLLPAA